MVFETKFHTLGHSKHSLQFARASSKISVGKNVE